MVKEYVDYSTITCSVLLNDLDFVFSLEKIGNVAIEITSNERDYRVKIGSNYRGVFISEKDSSILRIPDHIQENDLEALANYELAPLGKRKNLINIFFEGEEYIRKLKDINSDHF